jgi:hypothetical protein
VSSCGARSVPPDQYLRSRGIGVDPTTGPALGREIANLKAHYRMLLAEQGFVVLYGRPAKLQPEGGG